MSWWSKIDPHPVAQPEPRSAKRNMRSGGLQMWMTSNGSVAVDAARERGLAPERAARTRAGTCAPSALRRSRSWRYTDTPSITSWSRSNTLALGRDDADVVAGARPASVASIQTRAVERDRQVLDDDEDATRRCHRTRSVWVARRTRPPDRRRACRPAARVERVGELRLRMGHARRCRPTRRLRRGSSTSRCSKCGMCSRM